MSVPLPPHAQVMQFILGKWISRPIHLVVELGLPDLCARGPKSIEEMAQITQTHGPTLYRVMRALAGLNIFRETHDGRFELTPMAECLKEDALGPIARMFLSDWHDRTWAGLAQTVRTGKPAFEAVHGKPAFEWLAEHPEEARDFHEANAVKSRTTNRAIVEAYNFSDLDSLIDVGGGNGTLMAEILKANPGLTGVVADLSQVTASAEDYIRSQNLQERCSVVECNFFEKIPAGRQAILMSNILHDWDDETCQVILGQCHRALEPGARLLVVEAIIPPGNEFSVAKLLDLEVLVMGGGRERTESEFRSLFQSTGFKLDQTIAARESVSLIVGIRG